MADINYDEPIENLPDAFAKNTDSNNYKLLSLNTAASEKQERIFRDLFNMLDINSASGAALDHIYGERFRLKRGGSNDLQYRTRLKAKIMQNTSDGSFPKIVEAVAYMLQCKESDIVLEASNTENAIAIRDIPLDKIQMADFTINQLLELIQFLLSEGVKIEECDITTETPATLYFGTATVLEMEMEMPSVEYATYEDIREQTYEQLRGKTYREILYGEE